MQAGMKFIKDCKLYVEQEAKLLRKGAQWPITVCDGFEKIINTYGGVCWFGCIRVDTIVVDFSTFLVVNDVLIAR